MSVFGRLGKGDVGEEGGSCDDGGDVGIVLCALFAWEKSWGRAAQAHAFIT